MIGDLFILEGHKVVRRGNLSVSQFACKLMASNYRVAETFVGKIRISTIFLGVDVSLDGRPPVLFETMVFDSNDKETDCQRYTNWQDAEKGHKECVKRVTKLEEVANDS